MKKIFILILMCFNILMSEEISYDKNFKEFKNIDYIYINDVLFKRTVILLKNNKGDTVSKNEKLDKVEKKNEYI